MEEGQGASRPESPARPARQLGTLVNQPTFVCKDQLKFLIMDAPHYDNITSYIDELHKYNVKDFVRTCERTYDESIVRDAGIMPHALPFPDGEPPTDSIIDTWMALVRDASQRDTAVGVHCLAGLGRAPVLVVIALIEHGMSNLDAIEFVRAQRRGAINKRQLQYLIDYKKRKHRRTREGRRWWCGYLI